ncbi:MAG TPA: GGDEF domain-containing protein [Solirubrobacterales bacterium]
MTPLRRVSGYFARREDPYAGGDLANAQRLSTLLWGLLVLLTLVLLSISGPEEPSEAAGWAIAGALVALGVVLVILSRRRRISSWGRLLATGYAVALGIGVMQWVAGGIEEPFSQLLLVPVVFVVATQPPRRIAAFMLFVLAVLMAPLLYDGWDSDYFGASLASFVIWSILAVGANLLMSGVRAQRITLTADQAEARHQARVDSLTDLHNRRAYDEILAGEVDRARRLRLSLSVAMVDIENFKEINDRWGYAEGDRTLREVGDTLRASLREPDLCFRWGGDEFALILSGTPADETDPVAERLRAEVAKRCRRPDDSPVHIRFAAAQLRDGMSSEELTEIAGLAMTALKLDAR